MIKEIKDLMSTALVEAGIAESAIARTGKETGNLKTSGLDVFSTVLTGTGRFADPVTSEAMITIDGVKKMIKARIRRKLPLIVTITGRTEDEVDELFSNFINRLPSSFSLDGREGTIEPELEEHSDFDAAMDGRYSSVVRVLFCTDVGPSLLSTPLGVSSVEGDLEDD